MPGEPRAQATRAGRAQRFAFSWCLCVEPIPRVMAGRPVEVQLLYPAMGIYEPLAAVADRYDLDREALEAAAQSALAAPNRVVSVEVASASPA